MKPEYPARSHTFTARICKRHAERLGCEAKDLLGARRQCYQLCHHTAHVQTYQIKSECMTPFIGDTLTIHPTSGTKKTYSSFTAPFQCTYYDIYYWKGKILQISIMKVSDGIITTDPVNAFVKPLKGKQMANIKSYLQSIIICH